MTAEPMTHEGAADLFSAYLDRDLPLPDLRRIEDHLDSCDSCRDDYAAFAEAISLVRSVPRVRAPRGFARSVVGRAQRDRKNGFAARSASMLANRVPIEQVVPILLAAGVAVMLVLMAP